MGYYFDAKSTTIGSSLVILDKVVVEVEKLIISTDNLEDKFLGFKGEVQPLFITGRDNEEDGISVFNHPVRVSVKDKVYMVSDLRSCITRGEVSNTVEYSYIVSRNLLSCAWLDSYDTIKTDMELAGMVFSAWVADVVSKRYLLEAGEQSSVMVAALFYWLSLFEKEVNKDSVDLCVVKASKWFKLPSVFCYGVLEKLDRTEDIEGFCKMLAVASGNSRLESLNSGILITILGNTWYSINAKELIAVGLEHVPTYLSVIYAAVTQKNFRSSIIAKIAERYSKNGVGENFVRKYNELVFEFEAKI